jgi:ribosome maturation protein Sdo1
MLIRFVLSQGNQGILDAASNSQLENAFGTKKDDDVVLAILEKGDLIHSEVSLPHYSLR